jgi:Ca2+-binding EF-hand superfamily protein
MSKLVRSDSERAVDTLHSEFPVIADLGVYHPLQEAQKVVSERDLSEREDPTTDEGNRKKPRLMLPPPITKSPSAEWVCEISTKLFQGLDFANDEKISARRLAILLHHILRTCVKQKAPDTTETAGWQQWLEIEARAGISLMDSDDDGFITKSEFEVFLLSNPFLLGPLLHLEHLFRTYDKNHDLQLCEEELSLLLDDALMEQNMRAASAGEETRMPNPMMQKLALRKLFKTFDTDKNKTISFDEFVGVVLRCII